MPFSIFGFLKRLFPLFKLPPPLFVVFFLSVETFSLSHASSASWKHHWWKLVWTYAAAIVIWKRTHYVHDIHPSFLWEMFSEYEEPIKIMDGWQSPKFGNFSCASSLHAKIGTVTCASTVPVFAIGKMNEVNLFWHYISQPSSILDQCQTPQQTSRNHFFL